MIDANEPTPGGVVKQETPARITTSMIIADLDNGIDRNGIRDKYSLQAWEVKQMFEHPALKGKKAKKIRKLSFTFVDDTTNLLPPLWSCLLNINSFPVLKSLSFKIPIHVPPPSDTPLAIASITPSPPPQKTNQFFSAIRFPISTVSL